MTIFSDVMDLLLWSSMATPHSRHLQHGRALLDMEPDMKTFTITMPSVGVFIFGTAVCCFCCFKYGLQRWFERTLVKTRTKGRTGITYAASLQYKKEQLEHALRKVTKLRKAEPTRSDLKYESVALKEGIRMLNEHLRNSERYTDYCERQKRPSTDNLINKRISMEAHGNSFVNPIFSTQQAIDSGYMIDPVKKSAGEVGSPTSSDEECHNPKHKELELYLMSTGGAILPSMLKFPGSAAASPRAGFPGMSAPGSRMTSPLGRPEIDSEGRSLNVSPVQQGVPQVKPQNEQAFANRLQSTAQPDTQSVQSPPGMPRNWQQTNPVINQSSGSNTRLQV
ncbi:hypothetical protein KC19_4G163500 [Ceratodon purpureus]|uniref:Uncharacterized protein n=1 Tax=Ceratodon purpureus TaxID=3225 RepID=A0A8T0IBI0_CERPU|nr:hypothetical protein KC19_4G163500 [Ceratodon purpureus]